MATLNFRLEVAPHGHGSKLILDGVEAKNVKSARVDVDATNVSILTVTYINVEGEVVGEVLREYPAPVEAAEEVD